MVTLEQLLLPVLTVNAGKNFSYIISNIADTAKPYKTMAVLWSPNAYDRREFNKGNVIQTLKYMKHVWGTKNPYISSSIAYIVKSIIEDVELFFPEKKELCNTLQGQLYDTADVSNAQPS